MVADLFPWWAGWMASLYLPTTAFAASFLIANLAARLALIGRRRRSADPWYVVARRLIVARAVVSSNVLLLPAGFLTATLLLAGPISRIPADGLGALVWLAALAGAILAGYPVGRRIYGQGLTFAYWARGMGVLLIVFYPAWVVAVLLLLALPNQFDVSGVLILGVGSFFLVACYCGGTLPLARRLGLLRPATPRLEAITARASDRVGVRPRRLYVLSTPMSNALVITTTKTLAVTDAALGVLDDDELEAITAHELGHLGEGKGAILARSSVAVALAILVSTRPLVGSFGGLAMPATIVASLVWMNLVARFARRMEVRADTFGKHYEADEGTYARALEKIHRANLIPPIMGRRRGVHPELYDRMIAAGLTPDYPRPRPPSQAWTITLGVVSLFLAMGAGALIWLGPAMTRADRPERAGRLVLAASLTGGMGTQLGDLARLRSLAGDREGAGRLQAAASVRNRENFFANAPPSN